MNSKLPSAALTFGMRAGLIALMVVGYLVSAAVAKADGVIYNFDLSAAGLEFSWSFEVPGILTTTATITSFLITNIVSNPVLGCNNIDSATISDPQTSFSSVSTGFSGGCDIGATFDVPIDSFKTFTAGGPGTIITLTLSPSAVPEPSSLLLLGAGLVGALGLVRKKLA